MKMRKLFKEKTIMNDIYTTQINESIASLFANMEQRISAEDMQHVRDAYALAAEAHKEQRRKTGEPYIIHPIAVARIVAEELELGANPVIAAFLHDVVEDTDYTIEEIREHFGDDVAFLVGSLPNKRRISTRSRSRWIIIARFLHRCSMMCEPF